MNDKSTYNPKIHHRRSIRLKGYDYSRQGLFFVTICTKNKACLFGEIINDEMLLNEAGLMVEKWYEELENKFCDIRSHEHIVMPNHFHCIIENVGENRRICSGDGVRPLLSSEAGTHVGGGGHIGPPLRGEYIFGEHIGSPLWRVIQWFKTMPTNEYIRNVKDRNWSRFNGKLWQRNYWEHIIRDEKSYLNISEYIINNPRNWDHDSINPGKQNK